MIDLNMLVRMKHGGIPRSLLDAAVKKRKSESKTYVTAVPDEWIVAISAYVTIRATVHNPVGEVSYQWYKKAHGETEISKTTLGGNTTDTLNYQQNTARSGYSYACEVTDDNGKHMSNFVWVKRPE